MRVAFATCSAMPDGWDDDVPTARALGADFRSWDDASVDWEAYDRVVIRSTWDYTQRVEEFVRWCKHVGPQRLRNRPELVAFNVDKRYLQSLAAATVPTLAVADGEPLPSLEGEVVVKPNVSAGARDTGRFGPDTHALAAQLVARIVASGRVALVQPYIAAVDTDGETSVVFLGGTCSHVLRKRAVLAPDEIAPTTDGDLGVATAMLSPDLVGPGTCSERELVFAEGVIAEVSQRFGTPLYARVDIVVDSDRPMLLELEVVEPNLYMAGAAGAHARFAAAVLAS